MTTRSTIPDTTGEVSPAVTATMASSKPGVSSTSTSLADPAMTRVP